MSQAFGRGVSLVSVHLHHVLNQVLCLCRDLLPVGVRETIVSLHYPPDKDLQRNSLTKRGTTAQQNVQDDPSAPHITLKAVAPSSVISRNDFWRKVGRSSAHCLHDRAIFKVDDCAQSEVSDLDRRVRALGGIQDILWFQVSVRNTDAVKVLDRPDDLVEAMSCFCFTVVIFLHDPVEELPAADVFHHYVDLVVGFKHFMEFNAVGVLDFPHDVDFFPDILVVFLAAHLIQNLDCNDITRFLLLGSLHLCEFSFPDCFIDIIILLYLFPQEPQGPEPHGLRAMCLLNFLKV
mmetsp:Transcript_52695/g.163506  ORF Transcript_52695/g.163506 Transcript_52695/m.163506 type:complete len:291 (-) Transcript_52695:128-1000(-)